MDKILIRDLKINCIIGTNPEERETPQDVIVNLVLDCDLSVAGGSDDLTDTLNYRTLKRQIVSRIRESQFFLIERMAREIVDLCLGDNRVAAVTVSIDKPGALSGARSVAVEIRRERDS